LKKKRIGYLAAPVILLLALVLLAVVLLGHAEEGFVVQCETPVLTDVPSYVYEATRIKDLDSAASLVEQLFPDFKIVTMEATEDNWSFWFKDKEGKSIRIRCDGHVRMKTSSPLVYGDPSREYNLESLERKARDYARLHGVQSDLYLISIGQMVEEGITVEGKTGPCFIFGRLVDGVLLFGDQIRVWFNIDGEIVEFVFKETKIRRVSGTTPVRPVEECLTTARRQIVEMGKGEVSKRVTNVRIAYYFKEGKLVPCWWITTKSKGRGSAKSLIVDATSGDFVRVVNRYH